MESVFNYYNAKNELTEQIVARLESKAEATEDAISFVVGNYLNISALSKTELERILKNAGHEVIGVGSLEVAEEYFYSLDSKNSDIKNIAHISQSGDILFSSSFDKEDLSFLNNIDVNAIKHVVFLGLFSDKNNKIFAHTLYPVKFSGETIGYVYVIFDPTPLLEITENYSQLGETGEVLVAVKGSSGDAIFQTPLRFNAGAALKKAVGKEKGNLPITKAVNGIEDTFLDTFDYRGEKVIAVTTYIDSISWGVVAKIDKDEALRPITNLLKTYGTVGAIVVLILTLVAYVISVIFTSPIEKLTKRITLATGSAKIGIWEWDVVKNILTWDDQMYALYGIKKEDFSGAYDAWQNGLHPEDKERGDKEIKLALTDKKKFDTTFRVVWPNKSTHYIRAFAFVERDKSGKPLKMVGVNFDITDQMNIDQAKTELVSLASHQLRTPLTSINWYTEMLLAGDAGKLKTKQQEYLSAVYASSQRMTSLINSLLNVSRIELGTFSVNPKMTNILDLVTSVINEQQEKIISKKLKIKTNFPNKSQEIEIDPTLVRIIFQNLITNAVKYTNNNGSINISITLDKTNFILTVSDDGIGIPKNQQDKIFTKLYRADNVNRVDTNGTGLGLYLVKAIVGVLEGQISFESYEGKGSTFTVLLPKKMKAKEGDKKLTLL